MGRLDAFRTLHRRFRQEMLTLAHSRATAGNTPFYKRSLARFETEVVAPMDAAWAALPPTERQMFLSSEEKASHANSSIESIFDKSNHK